MYISSLIDPPAESPIVDGVMWVQGVALGYTATAVAVTAVAAIGFLMLSGKLALRRGIAVVAGCFILFGANGLAMALLGLASQGAPPHYPANPEPSQSINQASSSLPSSPAYDPYAGAAVPVSGQ